MKTEENEIPKRKARSTRPLRSLATFASVAVISALVPLEGAAADLTIYGSGGGGSGEHGGSGAGAVIHYDGSTYAGNAGSPGGTGGWGMGGAGFSGLPFYVEGGRGGDGGSSISSAEGGYFLQVSIENPLSLHDITIRGGQGGYDNDHGAAGGSSDPAYSGGAGGVSSSPSSLAGLGGDVFFDALTLNVSGDIDIVSGASGSGLTSPAGTVFFGVGELLAVGTAAQNFSFHTVRASEPGVAPHEPRTLVFIGTLVLHNDVTLSFHEITKYDDIQVINLEFDAGKTLTIVNDFAAIDPGSAANIVLAGHLIVNGPGAVLDMSGSTQRWDARQHVLYFDDVHPGLVGQVMLTYVSSGDLLVEGSNVSLGMRSASETFTYGDTITLIGGSIDAGSGLADNQVRAWAGATYYDFDLVLDALGLNAVFLRSGADSAEPRTYVHGLTAGMLFARSRGDAIADSLAEQLPRLHGPFAFSSVSGGHLKGGLGRNVSVDSGFAAAGLGVGVEGEGMYTAVGVFLDYGFGDWKAGNPSAITLSSSKGDLESHGLGVIGRMDFDRARVRLDASFAYGRIKNELAAMSDLLDHAATYDYRADTWNVHLAGRKRFALTQTHGLEVNAALLYAWQSSDSFITSFNERLKAESGDSFRTRLGARYVMDAAPGTDGETFHFFVGGAWEKEYRGKNGMRLEGEKIDYRNALRGDSGLGEIGMAWNTAGWEFNLTATGRFGDTKGYGGRASAGFRF